MHITGAEHYLLPFLRNVKTVVTIHDLGFFVNNRLSYRSIIKYLLFIKTLPLASYLTFISEKSKIEALRFVKLQNDRYSVILNPVSTEFIACPKNVNKKYPVILHIGTGSNKNIESTAIALKDFPCKLIIVGKLSEGQKFILDLYHTDYECMHNLTDNEILDLYKFCDVVNFPSLYEGFGIPPLEAMACERPTIVAGNEGYLRNI